MTQFFTSVAAVATASSLFIVKKVFNFPQKPKKKKLGTFGKRSVRRFQFHPEEA